MKKNQRYTAAFKAEAVQLVLEQKLSHQEAAQRVGIPKGSLSHWVASSQRRGAQALKAEVSRLHRELARVEMEQEVVKNRPRTLRGSRCKVRGHEGVAGSTRRSGGGAVRGEVPPRPSALNILSSTLHDSGDNYLDVRRRFRRILSDAGMRACA